MDYASLPHFCKREGSGSSKHSGSESENCYSLDHPFHQQLYNYIKEQSRIYDQPIKQGSFHVDFPEPAAEEAEIAETIIKFHEAVAEEAEIDTTNSELKKFDNSHGNVEEQSGIHEAVEAITQRSSRIDLNEPAREDSHGNVE